jgi:hypothetical protein
MTRPHKVSVELEWPAPRSITLRPLGSVLSALPQRLGFLQHPGVHGLDEGITADEVHLQGQDAEQQVASAVGREGVAAELRLGDYPVNAPAPESPRGK